MPSNLKLSRRSLRIIGIALCFILGTGIALAVGHRSNKTDCTDNGVIGYCCQLQQHKLVEEGKQPDSICPG